MLCIMRAYWIALVVKAFREIAPAYRPYPKPTQVDW
jgi:hypothetical protein